MHEISHDAVEEGTVPVCGGLVFGAIDRCELWDYYARVREPCVPQSAKVNSQETSAELGVASATPVENVSARYLTHLNTHMGHIGRTLSRDLQGLRSMR